jgi:hypothetical protein
MNESLAVLQVPGGEITEVALALPADLPEARWADIGHKLVPMAQASQWWVGDWILYGERLYGKRKAYSLAVEATGYAKDTLYQYARIAERIEKAVRRTGLPFSVHREVECLPPADQAFYLSQAAEHGYGEEKLRELIEGAQASGDPAPEPDKPPQPEKQERTVGVKLPVEVYNKLQDLALARGYTKQTGYSQIPSVGSLLAEIVIALAAAPATEAEIERYKRVARLDERQARRKPKQEPEEGALYATVEADSPEIAG